jgi:hypothetical protein
MAGSPNRGIPTLPSTLIRQPPPTPQPEPNAEASAEDMAEQGGEAGGREPRPARRRPARKPAAEGPGTPRKLTLPDDVYERLQLQALQKRTTASAIATDVLNRNLPRFRVEREG